MGENGKERRKREVLRYCRDSFNNTAIKLFNKTAHFSIPQNRTGHQFLSPKQNVNIFY